MKNKNRYKAIYIILSCFVLTFCGCMESPPELRPLEATTVIRVYAQTDFFDKPLFDEFEKKSGLKLESSFYDSRDAALANLQENPGAFDLIIAETQTANLFASLKLVDSSAVKRILKRLSQEDSASIPYLQGVDGLALSSEHISSDISGWEVLFDDAYSGRISLIDHPRESVGAILKYSGLPINTIGNDDLMVAELNAGMLVENGVSFGEAYQNLNELIDGTKWIAQVRSGDYAQRVVDKETVRFVYPAEGFGVFQVSLAIGKDSRNSAGALRLIQFLIEPQNAELTAKRLHYKSLIPGVSQGGDKFAYPPERVQKLGEKYSDLKEVANVHEKIFSLARILPKETIEEDSSDTEQLIADTAMKVEDEQ